MNYLAHLLLAGNNRQAQLGALLGDFTRGRLETLAKRYPAGVIHGISVHRRVDRFTDDHFDILRSRTRFSKARRRYAGVIVDVLHDHFLSRHWDSFSVVERGAFIAHCYTLLNDYESLLPGRLKRIAPLMVEQDWLDSYLQISNIDRVLQRLSKRIRRNNPLYDSIDEVTRNYHALETDFLAFFPDVHDHATRLNQRFSPMTNSVAAPIIREKTGYAINQLNGE